MASFSLTVFYGEDFGLRVKLARHYAKVWKASCPFPTDYVYTLKELSTAAMVALAQLSACKGGT